MGSKEDRINADLTSILVLRGRVVALETQQAQEIVQGSPEREVIEIQEIIDSTNKK